MESYNAVNITLDVFSAAITILILVYLVSRRNNTKENRCFLWICIWNLLFILGDLSDWCCNGLAHSWYAIVLPVGQFIYYAVLAPFMITMLDYVSAYLSNYGRISPVYKYIIYVLAGLHSLGCILTPFTGLYYEISEDNIYYRGTWVALASVLPIVMYLIVTVLAFRFRKKLCGRAFMALLSYMCFPMLGHVIQNIFRGVATLNPAITLAILFIFFNIQLDRDVQHEKDKQKLMEANVKVMLSQIRPHFLLNTLAAIQGLCDIEPEKAKASINDFSMFLRANMNSLTNDEVIPFEQELLHVRSYLNLIQQMYGNRIQVMYDIQGKEFYLPSLSMQPIVENAVYKGLLTKKEGGTITIRTREENNGFWIFIEDNGVGFSMDVLKEEGHLGIDNVKRRIEIMCNGKVLLDSVVGKGTSIGLYLPKNSGECYMNFLIVDDMNIILEAESRLLKEIMPECQVCACTDGADALLHAKEEVFHVAFLDIELGVGKPDGIMLAKQLKDLQPQLHIIFVTAYQSYAVEAFSIHATGYLLKPIQKERMKQELTFLYQEDCISEKRIKVRTFGNFEVWVDGRQLNFGRQKSKELFAYLVDRKGSGVTTREACAVLFEDGVYNLSRKSNFQNIVADMRNTFKKLGLEGVIKKQYNYLAVDTDKLDCDYYRFLNGDVKVINQYNGEFMTNYSWAEFDAPMFSHKF